MNTLTGTLTRQGDKLIITEKATMKEPEKPRGDNAVWDREEFSATHRRWREHIASIRSFEAIGFSEKDLGKEVAYVTGYQGRLMAGNWINITKEDYDQRYPHMRRQVALPAPASAATGKPEGEIEVNALREIVGNLRKANRYTNKNSSVGYRYAGWVEACDTLEKMIAKPSPALPVKQESDKPILLGRIVDDWKNRKETFIPVSQYSAEGNAHPVFARMKEEIEYLESIKLTEYGRGSYGAIKKLYDDYASRPQPSSGDGSCQRAASVKEVMKESSGLWQPCSGCHETTEGQEVGHNPYSEIFNCYIGSGCHECGGIGAVWNDYGDIASTPAPDKEEMMNFVEWANQNYGYVSFNKWDGDEDETYTTGYVYAEYQKHLSNKQI